MVDVVLRSGDELPIIERVFQVDGVAVDLTTASGVTFKVDQIDGTNVWTHNAQIVAPTASGVVRYGLTSTDSGQLAPGFYQGHFVADFAGLTLTAPNEGFISIQITSSTAGVATYTGNPGARPIDSVRFLAQDTVVDTAKLTDAEITWMLTEQGGTIYDAAADAAEQIASVYAGYKDKTVGPLSIRYGDLSQRYIDMAGRLRKRRGRLTGFAAVNTQYSQEHLIELGMHDYEWTGDPLNGGYDPSLNPLNGGM